jgi:hypothetical protein
MRTKLFIVVALVATLALMVASPAFAGQQTRILYGLENYDVEEVTPAQGGYMRVEVSWTGMDGTGTPLFPVAEVDGIVQSDDGTELYMDLDWGDLYLGTNPQVHTAAVVGGQKYYVSVAPFIGDAPYRLRCLFDTKSNGTFSTVLLDTGAIDINNVNQRWAYGIDGEVYVPSQGTWHSVLQYWPGTIGVDPATSNVYANYDDYVFGTADYGTLVSNWAGLEYYPPIVSNAAIGPTGDALWYTVCPEIWTAAARPNVWTDYGFDAYPKPGDLAYNAAPLWYTYSWPDAAKTENVAYMATTTASKSASGHAFGTLVNTNSTITYAFTGTSVKWIYNKGPSAGVAKVTIDGGVPTTADLYNATAQFKQSTTYGGLADTTHTIVVQSNKTKNAASANFAVYHDAFEATQFAGDAQASSEGNTDGSTEYAWGKTNTASAHGGSFSSDHTAGAALACTFTGTSVDFIYNKGPNAGIARVYIDGVDKGTVDLYASGVAFQQSTTFGALPAGMHTIMIVNNKTKNAASGNFLIYFDAFKVGAVYYEN